MDDRLKSPVYCRLIKSHVAQRPGIPFFILRDSGDNCIWGIGVLIIDMQSLSGNLPPFWFQVACGAIHNEVIGTIVYRVGALIIVELDANDVDALVAACRIIRSIETSIPDPQVAIVAGLDWAADEEEVPSSIYRLARTMAGADCRDQGAPCVTNQDASAYSFAQALPSISSIVSIRKDTRHV